MSQSLLLVLDGISNRLGLFLGGGGGLGVVEIESIMAKVTVSRQAVCILQP